MCRVIVVDAQKMPGNRHQKKRVRRPPREGLTYLICKDGVNQGKVEIKSTREVFKNILRD